MERIITLSLPEQQVVELARQLSDEGKLALLRALIPEMNRLEELVNYGAERIRALCAERGIDWDALSEDERQRLIDEILHEK